MRFHDHTLELEMIEAVVHALRKRIAHIALEGGKVDQINAAISQLSGDIDALIAKGSGAITPAQAAEIANALTSLDAKIKAALGA